MWLHTPNHDNQEVGREYWEFKVIFHYTATLRPARATWDPISNKQTRNFVASTKTFFQPCTFIVSSLCTKEKSSISLAESLNFCTSPGMWKCERRRFSWGFRSSLSVTCWGKTNTASVFPDPKKYPKSRARPVSVRQERQQMALERVGSGPSALGEPFCSPLTLCQASLHLTCLGCLATQLPAPRSFHGEVQLLPMISQPTRESH